MAKILFLAFFYFVKCSAADYASEDDIKAVAEICSPEAASKQWGDAKFSTRNEENYNKLVKTYKEFLLQKEQLISTEKELSNQVSLLKERKRHNYKSSEEKRQRRRDDLNSLPTFLQERGLIFDQEKLAGLKTYKEAIKFISGLDTHKGFQSSTDYLNRKHSEALESEGWNKITNPLKHKPEDYRYLVHGIKEGSKGEAILTDDNFFKTNESLVLSVSVIDKQLRKLTTAIPSGVILEVPKTNIFACSDTNMNRCGASSAAMNCKFGMRDLDDVLNKTVNGHNELTVESRIRTHELDSVIGIAGYFINIGSVSWKEKKLSKSRLEQIKEVCVKYHRPVILIN